jgi:cell division septal protein FtsQ
VRDDGIPGGTRVERALEVKENTMKMLSKKVKLPLVGKVSMLTLGVAALAVWYFYFRTPNAAQVSAFPNFDLD